MSWNLSFILLLVLPMLVALLTFLFHQRKKQVPPLPPSPFSFPLIGHMMLVKKMNPQGLASLAEKHSGGTGLLYLRLGHLHTLTISTPDMAKQAFQVHDIIFSNRPSSIAISYLTYDRADMAFANYGPFWRQMRRLCLSKLFGRRQCESSWATVHREVSATVIAIAKQSGSLTSIGNMIFALAKNITFSSVFGSQSHENEKEFLRIVQEFSALFGTFHIGDFFPWLRWLDFNGVMKRAKRARCELDAFIEKIIDEHRMSPKGLDDVNRDMVDEMLDFLVEENGCTIGQLEALKNLRLSRDNIKAVIMDLMFGGIEPVATTIEWAMAELMRSPSERKKVQDELEKVVGIHHRITEADLEKLSYLKCVIKETLRLHPPSPVPLHETADDVVIGGRFIRSRTRVMINVWAIGRDKSAWKDPNAFRPSRFVAAEGESADIDFWGSSFEFIPFGSGRRSCPAMRFGIYIAEMALAELMHCFDWELPNRIKPSELSMEDVYGLMATRVVRLEAVPVQRLTCVLDG